MSTLSGTTLERPIETFNQLGGRGRITNKALAIPVHLGGPWNSVEYVELAPAQGCPTEVGEHVQGTDEFYLVVKGSGLLTTNGHEEEVGPGFLAIAPRGTRHRLSNPSTRDPLSLLVVELKAPETGRPPVSIPNIFARLDPGVWWHPASKPLLIASVDLSAYFSGPWGTLRVVHVPDGTRVLPYALTGADELLFVSKGFATIIAGENSFASDSEADGLSVIVPAGMPRRITNHASSPLYPFLLVSLEVRRDGVEHVGEALV
jgi:mannose-6-phosphate isomerase-like protein (cupin superfamily)